MKLEHVRRRSAELKKFNLLRHYVEVEPTLRPTKVLIDGREVTMFCTNDYLGLARHEDLKEAMSFAAAHYGCGTGSSRFLGGTNQLHHQVEQMLANFHGHDQCALFANGYMANLGAVSTLSGTEDVIFSDAHCHASIIDGCRLGHGAVKIWLHNDVEDLLRLLKSTPCRGHRIVVFESLYSMGGDFSPVAEILAVAKEFGCITYIDEIHAVGIYGDGGRGYLSELGMALDSVDILMGGTGKAFGVLGGYIASGEAICTVIKSQSRPFIFTTAMPAVMLSAILKSLELVQSADNLRSAIRRNSALLSTLLKNEGFEHLNSRSHIFPVMTGSSETTAATCAFLLKEGIFAQGAKYPTVPKDKGRIRVTVTADHTEEDLINLVEVLKAARDAIPGLAKKG